jgi:hypothetical protein
MTVWVIRDGVLVEKGSIADAVQDRRSIFPTPMLSRMEPFESPVTGREITSWRERDRDMEAVGACDPRDLPRGPFEKREQANATRRSDDTEFEWR